MANTNSTTVDSIGFRKKQYPAVLEVANELAELENRKAHDSIRILILVAGKAKIEHLKKAIRDENPTPLKDNSQDIKVEQGSQA